jgi:geranylgeranyl pyrophosphate synthase
VSRELAEATLGMIGGQHLDIHGEVHDLAVLHRLKTGRLFAASVGCALWAADVPVPDQLPWREFGEELGLLFQIVDDVLDEDGYFAIHGAEGARALAMDAAARAHERLAAIDADTAMLGEIVTDLAVRTT